MYRPACCFVLFQCLFSNKLSFCCQKKTPQRIGEYVTSVIWCSLQHRKYTKMIYLSQDTKVIHIKLQSICHCHLYSHFIVEKHCLSFWLSEYIYEVRNKTVHVFFYLVHLSIARKFIKALSNDKSKNNSEYLNGVFKYLMLGRKWWGKKLIISFHHFSSHQYSFVINIHIYPDVEKIGLDK